MLLAALLAIVLASQGQTPAFASVAATVTDSTGAIIPGVAVWATSDPDKKVSCVTNVRGECAIQKIEPGRYLLEASLSGFETERTRVDIASGETFKWNVKLVVAGGRSAIDLVEHITKITGPNPADCGKFRPARPFTETTAEQVRPSLACAASAAAAHKPFWITNQHQGIDSIIIDGLAGTSEGVIYRYDFDSAPCGNPGGCPSRLTTQRCDHPTLVDRGGSVWFACAAENRKPR
jgi:hypothetical protein